MNIIKEILEEKGNNQICIAKRLYKSNNMDNGSLQKRHHLRLEVLYEFTGILRDSANDLFKED